MKTYEEVADHAGLTGRTKQRFIQYMTIRWKSEEETHCKVGYAHEWAKRFAARHEYGASDIEGQAVLNMIGE